MNAYVSLELLCTDGFQISFCIILAIYELVYHEVKLRPPPNYRFCAYYFNKLFLQTIHFFQISLDA